MDIHPATAADADRLSQLACQTYRAHFATLWRPARLEAYLRSEFGIETLQRALVQADQAWYLAVDAGGAPLGFAKVNWDRVEPCSGRKGAHLQKIYFHAHATGRGLGAQLLAHVSAAAGARGQTWLWLQVLGCNERAHRFYLRHGFLPLGTSIFSADIGPIAMHSLGRTLR